MKNHHIKLSNFSVKIISKFILLLEKKQTSPRSSLSKILCAGTQCMVEEMANSFRPLWNSKFWFPDLLKCGSSEPQKSLTQFMDLDCLLEELPGMIKVIINLLLLLLSVVINLSRIFTQKCVLTLFINP